MPAGDCAPQEKLFPSKDKKPRRWQREGSVMVATKYEKTVENDKDDEKG